MAPLLLLVLLLLKGIKREIDRKQKIEILYSMYKSELITVCRRGPARTKSVPDSSINKLK